MKVGRAVAAAAGLVLAGFAVNARAQDSVAPPPSPVAAVSSLPASPRELYRQLNSLRVDHAEVYSVKDLLLRKEDVRLTLEDGKLAFLTPILPLQGSAEDSRLPAEARVTGAVFIGRGHALAIPRDPVEKQQMARFLGAPLLDQWFTSAYMRFTDATAEELKEQLSAKGVAPEQEPAFAEQWNDVLAALNPGSSLRILEGWLSDEPEPFFYAALRGVLTGSFDVLLDSRRRSEHLLLGQRRVVGDAAYYDVWASYALPGAPLRPLAIVPARYEIETTVFPDRTLEGTTTIHLRSARAGERVIEIELSRFLAVQSAEWTDGEALDFFQNEDVNRRALTSRGNDEVLVVLPRPTRLGEEFALRLHYKGTVISDVGNGVLFVGDRGSWYPHIPGMDNFTPYDIELRWPRQLKVAATGTKLQERDDGEFKVGRWRSEEPIPVAGFNLGDYSSVAVTDKNLHIDVYANRQLESALEAKVEPPPLVLPLPPGRGGVSVSPMPNISPVTASPADALKRVGRAVSSSIRFYEQFSGPFPFDHLSVSQIPGAFGQGWPGLLYVSTLSFLPDQVQARAGLNPTEQELFSQLMPFHEVAHQWWGNVVGWSSYRDQWINEAIANYLAMMFADSQKSPERSLRRWLEYYRAQLLGRLPGEEEIADEAGPLVMGSRLTSSKSPGGFERVVYGKGAWVFHMLRMMLRQPDSRDPDARFRALLRTLAAKYRFQPLTTQDLQREVEAVMTPAMDLEGRHSMEWFFAEWVRGTGIPRYRVEFSARPGEKGVIVRGALLQTGVPKSFVAPVPVYATGLGGKQVYLGTVVATGQKTPFRFTTVSAPHKLVIDPQMTLLCVAE
ncbi:MAG: M1 family aminopeptidase [Candidatus Acidiferrales bacterium]|jgi:hypothetical protein